MFSDRDWKQLWLKYKGDLSFILIFTLLILFIVVIVLGTVHNNREDATERDQRANETHQRDEAQRRLIAKLDERTQDIKDQDIRNTRILLCVLKEIKPEIKISEITKKVCRELLNPTQPTSSNSGASLVPPDNTKTSNKNKEKPTSKPEEPNQPTDEVGLIDGIMGFFRNIL